MKRKLLMTLPLLLSFWGKLTKHSLFFFMCTVLFVTKMVEQTAYDKSDNVYWYLAIHFLWKLFILSTT
mgnify:FL=1